MAFEVPLEADRVDDLNFFSTVWRAPVIGTIFWILGGDKARRVEEEQEKQDLHPSAGGDSVDGGGDRDVGFGQEEQLSAAADDNMKRSFSRRSSLKKNTPSLADSEVSELADVGESLEGLSLSKGKHGHRKKELSWSDESGKDLAEIIHESSNPIIRERPQTGAAGGGGPTTQRAAAASLPRTMSCRNGRLEQDVRAEVEHHRRNLFDRQFSQTEPFPGAPDNESPQWGWYINTTPPTPDMYYASRPQKASRRENSDDTALTARMSCESASSGISSSRPPAGTATATNTTAATIITTTTTMPKYHPNPVFRQMQDKNKSVPMDWPTVPL